MARQKTSRLKCNPQLGRIPVLQMLLPQELEIDESYQRSIEAADSQNLIRRIAQHWNWDLCQPLVVSRRRIDGADRFFVIDGQHRLEAAHLRGDIPQLPGVVVEYATAADEAASFVNLNQQRRPLNALQLFKAALASGDEEAVAIAEALQSAGLSIAPHSNHTAWKPGMVSNISGIRQAWNRYGAVAAAEAMKVLARAFEGEVLQYAGTVYPGIAAVVAAQGEDGLLRDSDFATLVARVGQRGQETLRQDVGIIRTIDPNLNYKRASAKVIAAVFAGADPVAAMKAEMSASPAATPAFNSEARIWCDQCDRQVSPAKAASCTSKFCTVKLEKAA